MSVLHNIRFKDVDNADTDDGEEYTITIGKHETSGVAGGRSKKAAFITVSKDIYNDLLLYSRTIRDIYKYLDPTATVFRNRAGEPVTTNRIGKMAKAAWKKAGMTVNINMTILRKLCMIQGRKADPSMASSIARQLCHRVSTADDYYAVHDDRQEAKRVYRHLKASFSKPTATVTSAEALHKVGDSCSFSGQSLDTTLPAGQNATDSETIRTDNQSTITADSDIIPPSITGETSPEFTATPLNLYPFVRLRRLKPSQISSLIEENTDEEAAEQTAPLSPEPEQTPVRQMPEQSPVRQMPVLSPAPKSAERSMPVLSSVIHRSPLQAHHSKYVSAIQFNTQPKYKVRTNLDPAKRHEIREAYQEVILEYMMLPFRSVPIDAIRFYRDGRWPELSELQLRDIVRNVVKSARREDIRNNPDDYLVDPE